MQRSRTLQSDAAFVLHGAETTTVRSAGASLVFGAFAGIVSGESGTELTYTNEGGRAVVFGDGCDMTLDNASSAHRVVFGSGECVGLPIACDTQ